MAKRQGIYTGGKPRLDKERVRELSRQGLGPAAIGASWEWHAVQSTGSSESQTAAMHHTPAALAA